jgi:hypothetical protein
MEITVTTDQTDMLITARESDLIHMLASAWNQMQDLPPMGPHDQDEFRTGIHALQDMILARAGRRQLESFGLPGVGDRDVRRRAVAPTIDVDLDERAERVLRSAGVLPEAYEDDDLTDAQIAAIRDHVRAGGHDTTYRTIIARGW